MTAVVPMGFRTDGEYLDGPEDDESGSSGMAVPLPAIRGPECRPIVSVCGNSQLDFYPGGTLLRCNDNLGQGFLFAQRRDVTIGSQHVTGRHCIATDASDTSSERLSLVAPRKTDILLASAAYTPAGVDLDPKVRNSAVRAALYSAATIIAQTATQELQVGANEIEVVGVVRSATDGLFHGQIVFADELANGSGLTSWMRQEWTTLLERALDPASRISSCDCDAGCYRCMLDYRNRHLHGLMDRELGLHVLRIMADKTHEQLETDSWKAHATRLMIEFAKFFRQAEVEEIAGLPALHDTDASVHYVAVHPLRRAGTGALADAEIENAFPIDTFNLTRRMAWCRRSPPETFALQRNPVRELAGAATSSVTPIDPDHEPFDVSKTYLVRLNGVEGRARIRPIGDGLCLLPSYDFPNESVRSLSREQAGLIVVGRLT